MRKIKDYEGTFLNHLEGMYRAEDRDAAVALAEALGLAVVEMRFTENSRPLLAGHFNSEDRDPTNNVVFLYEMPELLRRSFCWWSLPPLDFAGEGLDAAAFGL